MKPSDALALLFGRGASVCPIVPPRFAWAALCDEATAFHEFALMVAGDDLANVRAVWGRWVAFRWAVEHPEDPVLVVEEEGP